MYLKMHCFLHLLSTSLCHQCLRDSSNRELGSPSLLGFSFLAFNKALTIRYPGGGGGVYRIEKNNCALKFFEKNN